jgi:hypothetical protein
MAQEVITGLVNSFQEEKTTVIMNERGFTQEQKNTVTYYEYLTKSGSRVTLPYKVKGLKDSRRFRVKHPILYLAMPLIPTLIWEGLRAVTPLP